MMNRYNSILQIALSAIFLLAGCEKADTAADSDARHTTLRVTTVPMTIVGEQVPYDTRASKPLNPEDENVIYSLAVLVFDESEGVLHKFDKSGKYYKYIDLKDENGNGLLSTKLPIEDFPVQPDETYTICLVANLSEEQVEKIINDMMADGTAFIHEFEEVSVMIPYVAPDKADGQLETGHVREIYMFGYYRGEVSAHGEISISLGRIISRLEIAFTIDKELDPKNTFYMRMNNLESHAHLFPIEKSPGKYALTGISRVSNLDNKRYTLYFYAAPNSALDTTRALNLEVWYGPKDLVDLNSITTRHMGYTTIYLCNDQPGVENRNYQLNRNSVYRFNIKLTDKE